MLTGKSRKPPAEWYTSFDVARLTGVSLRQLQWWDELGLVSPLQRRHRRFYQFREAVEVSLVTQLRRKGFSLQRIRKVLPSVRKELAKRLSDVLNSGGELYLLSDGKNLRLEQNHKTIVDLLNKTAQPMILVCLSDQIRRLTNARAKKDVGSERGPITRFSRVS